MREMLDSITQDVRFALRTLRSKPGFTVFASLSLALGIGANIAVFTLLYSVLINPLPYPESERLLFVEETSRVLPLYAAAGMDMTPPAP